MGFAEEFRDLDPALVEQAFANASERLLTIAGGEDSAELIADMFVQVSDASPGFMALVGRVEEAIEMLGDNPSLRYSEERFNMIQMSLGVIGVGFVLAEYAKLEQESE